METIFALSTSGQRAALHLTRVSGQDVLAKLGPFFRSRKTNTSIKKIEKSEKPVVRYLNLCDEEGQLVDDIVATFYFAPHSYTGEDCVEITSHGNPMIAGRVHSVLRAAGCVDAKPGEFTQRAFLNGKLDLAQAEAVATLIDAQTEGGIDLARKVSEGELSSVTLALQNEFVHALAYLEAHIDFGNDDIGSFDAKTVLPDLDNIQNKLTALSQSFSRGKKILEGVQVAIVGNPNAGKSSLYNALLQENRAIVTEIAGTTRDVISERLVIERRDFVLLDTAGLRKTDDRIETMGIERSYAAAQNADVVVMVLDASVATSEFARATNELRGVREKLSDAKKFIVALNKVDLIEGTSKDKLTDVVKELRADEVVFSQHQECEELRNALARCYDKLTVETVSPQAAILISKRQQDKVNASLKLLAEARDMVALNDYPEKISSVLQLAHRSLGEILGELSMDDVMAKIFSSFCIGK